MSPPRTRLKDIAAATGFSTNTVSLALRNSPLVTEDTRLVIAEAAKALRYRPNEIAKSLVQRQTWSVGLILTNIVNPILTQTAQAVETALSKRGYTTLFATSAERIEQEMRAIEVFAGRQVDGILVYPTNHTQLDHIRALRHLHIPAVVLTAESNAGVEAVSVRESLGARMATRHLLDLGHRRIGMIDTGIPQGNPEKVDGYRQSLAEAGIAFEPELLRTFRGYTAENGHVGMSELMALATPPTAVFGANDTLAIGAMDWCVAHGVRVPNEMSVIGFDNIPFAAYASTPLTTVSYDPLPVAQLAVERLLHLIEARDNEPPPELHFVEPHIAIRSSTAPPRRGAK